MSLVTSGRYLSDLEKEGKAFRLRPQAIDCTSLRIEVACMPKGWLKEVATAARLRLMRSYTEAFRINDRLQTNE